MTLALRYAAHTDVGLGPKTRNEDSGYAGPYLLAIADGMGGTVGGDVASAITITTVRVLDKGGHNEPLRALGQAAVEANSRIAARIDSDPHLEGMGTMEPLRSSPAGYREIPPIAPLPTRNARSSKHGFGGFPNRMPTGTYIRAGNRRLVLLIRAEDI
jgi:hypothetical protein